MGIMLFVYVNGRNWCWGKISFPPPSSTNNKRKMLHHCDAIRICVYGLLDIWLSPTTSPSVLLSQIPQQPQQPLLIALVVRISIYEPDRSENKKEKRCFITSSFALQLLAASQTLSCVTLALDNPALVSAETREWLFTLLCARQTLLEASYNEETNGVWLGINTNKDQAASYRALLKTLSIKETEYQRPLQSMHRRLCNYPFVLMILS